MPTATRSQIEPRLPLEAISLPDVQPRGSGDRKAARHGESLRTMLVFAHPDDETVGMGASLARLRAVWFVCVTDGAPRDLSDAHRAGCDTREAYARLRQDELRAAVRCAGHAPERITLLGFTDQEASLRLVELARAIDISIGAVRPHLLVTHPYEGGHPDHDATAFGVHAAVQARRARGAATPIVVEMTSYHRRGGAMTFGEFLPGSPLASIVLPLGAAARARKQRLIACHASQAHVLGALPLECERFRRAPTYDFTRPPHPGTLLYEQFPWGMSGSRWRTLATTALLELGLGAARTTPTERQPCGSPC
jgi:LmbE family N-acetylglucosaminyl deacetylase